MIRPLCDENRYLVCVPYSIENLHAVAKELGIPKHWFHRDHYDIPKGKIELIKDKCNLISSREVVNIIKGI